MIQTQENDEKPDICHFHDDNLLFSWADNRSVILKSLGYNMKMLLRWSNLNSLKANPGKL